MKQSRVTPCFTLTELEYTELVYRPINKMVIKIVEKIKDIVVQKEKVLLNKDSQNRVLLERKGDETLDENKIELTLNNLGKEIWEERVRRPVDNIFKTNLNNLTQKGTALQSETKEGYCIVDNRDVQRTEFEKASKLLSNYEKETEQPKDNQESNLCSCITKKPAFSWAHIDEIKANCSKLQNLVQAFGGQKSDGKTSTTNIQPGIQIDEDPNKHESIDKIFQNLQNILELKFSFHIDDSSNKDLELAELKDKIAKMTNEQEREKLQTKINDINTEVKRVSVSLKDLSQEIDSWDQEPRINNANQNTTQCNSDQDPVDPNGSYEKMTLEDSNYTKLDTLSEDSKILNNLLDSLKSKLKKERERQSEQLETTKSQLDERIKSVERINTELEDSNKKLKHQLEVYENEKNSSKSESERDLRLKDEELTKLDAKLAATLSQVTELNEKINTLENRNTGLEQHVNNYQVEKSKLQEEIEELRSKIKELGVEHGQALRQKNSELDKLELELTSTKSQYTELEEQNRSLGKTNVELNESLQLARQELRKYEETQFLLRSKIEEMNADRTCREELHKTKISDREKEITELNTTLGDTRRESDNQIAQLKIQIDDIKSTNQQITDSLNKALEDKQKLENQLKTTEDAFQKEKNSLNSRINVLEQSEQNLTDEYRAANETIHNSKAQKELLEKSLEDSQTALELKTKDIQDLNQKLEALNKDTKNLRDEISKLNGQLNTMKDSNNKLNSEIKQKEETLTQTKVTFEKNIRLLEGEISTLKEENSKNEKEITNFVNQLQEQKQLNASLQLASEKEKKGLQNRISDLESNNKQSESINQAQKAKIEQQQKKIQEFEGDVASLQLVCKKIQKENENLKEANTKLDSELELLKKQSQQQKERDEKTIIKLSDDLNKQIEKVQSLEPELYFLKNPSYSQDVDTKKVPFVSIEKNTLFGLSSQTGWKITRNLPDKLSTLETTKVAIVSVIGSSGSGISWVSNQLSSGYLSYGWQGKPNSISLYYIQQRDGWFGILESSGFDAPVRALDKDIEKLIEPAFLEDNAVKQMISKEKLEMKRDRVDKYQVLDNDSRIIEDMNLLYSVKQGGIILLVVNRASKSERDRIARIQSMLADTTNKSEEQGMHYKPPQQLIVIHNLHWIKTQAHVQKELEVLKASLFVSEEPLYNDSSVLANAPVNKYLWKDNCETTHLIMASAHSEAGDFYNQSTVGFLLSKINILDNKESIQFTKSYAEFCGQKLTSFLGDTVEMQVGKERIASKQFKNVSRAKLLYNEDYMVFNKEAFKPKYSKQIIHLEGSKKRVIVIIDTLDAMIISRKLESKNNRTNLLIEGYRDLLQTEKDKDAEYLKCTKEDGQFRLMIPLMENMKKIDFQIDEKGRPWSLKVAVDFAPNEDIDL